MYRQESYHDEHYASPDGELTQSALDMVRHLLPPTGDLLDFGCGNGAFLKSATEAGFAAVGVELDPEVRKKAQEFSGCTVHSLAKLTDDGRTFDVMHLGDVLEHLPAPAKTLVELQTLLRPNGYWFIEGPVEEGISLVHSAARVFGHLKRLSGKDELASYPPFHLIRTNPRAQRGFFSDRMGLEVVKFIVFETGWPYINPGDRLSAPGSVPHLAKMLIGKMSMVVASLAAPVGLPVGNRFAAILRSPA